MSLRNARRDAVEAFKKAQKEGMPEDESKDGETQVQKLLEKFSKTLDAALDRKEAGDHDGLMAAGNERKRDAADGSIPFRSQSDGADQPIR